MSTGTFGPSALATPANAITLVRILLTPVVLVLIVNEGNPWVAAVVWAGVAISDMVDGYVARRQGATRAGAFLDPLADKVLAVTVMIALVVKDLMWWLPVALIMFRDAVVTIYRSYVGRHGISVPARKSAKIKTFAQNIAIGLAILPFSDDARRWVVGPVLWFAVILALVSGAQYLIDGAKRGITADSDEPK
ncbi:MAG: CDP-alcohol phosphatidyltransferase family protein [Actinomycetota bacterium]|nr:CDP-alcohol phosphatidyltransferase family protein [Actinomycetota bacterium]